MEAAGAMCVTVIAAAAAGCVIITALKYVMYHNIYLKMLPSHLSCVQTVNKATSLNVNWPPPNITC